MYEKMPVAFEGFFAMVKQVMDDETKTIEEKDSELKEINKKV